MTSYHARASPGGNSLARHIDSLASALDLIGERLREAIADAVGRTVADGVGAAVLAALSGHHVEPRSHRSSSSAWPGYPHSGWGEPDRPSWAREGHDHNERFYPSRYDEPDAYDDDYPEYDSTSESEAEQRPKSWVPALTSALQAAAWSIQRDPDRTSVSGSL